MNRNLQLDWLIRELSPAAAIPSAIEDKWLLFRGLVNIREPKQAGNEFLAVQDELLQSLIAEKGITDIADLRPVRDNIYLWRGDITTLKAGAVVNAANSGMLGCFMPNHACIDNAIQTYAGVQLRLECAAMMEKQGYPEPTGQAKITAAYNLPSKYVLHTVGPIITGRLTDKDCDLLASCYTSCLLLAEKNDIDSIAFCCISTGEFHFPNEKAAEIAIQTVQKFIAETQSKVKVIFNVFKETDYEVYNRLLRANR
jgi:O-acetyl-ADP-ribose deacetylase (regulator of RNase III)